MNQCQELAKDSPKLIHASANPVRAIETELKNLNEKKKKREERAEEKRNRRYSTCTRNA